MSEGFCEWRSRLPGLEACCDQGAQRCVLGANLNVMRTDAVNMILFRSRQLSWRADRNALKVPSYGIPRAVRQRFAALP